jgi:penicillin-binding protein 2
MQITSEVIAAEARRFHLDQPTGIELPGETHRMLIPDPTWKKEKTGDGWVPGDTANMAIGQGFVLVSPLSRWPASPPPWHARKPSPSPP